MTKHNEQAKKKKLSLGKIIGIIVFMIPIVFGVLFMYELSFKQVLLLAEQSPDKTHELEVFEVGEPIEKGPSTIRIEVGKEKVEVGLRDEGRILSEDNVDILWESDDVAMITLTGEGQDPTIVKFDASKEMALEVVEDGLGEPEEN